MCCKHFAICLSVSQYPTDFQKKTKLEMIIQSVFVWMFSVNNAVAFALIYPFTFTTAEIWMSVLFGNQTETDHQNNKSQHVNWFAWLTAWAISLYVHQRSLASCNLKLLWISAPNQALQTSIILLKKYAFVVNDDSFYLFFSPSSLWHCWWPIIFNKQPWCRNKSISGQPNP